MQKLVQVKNFDDWNVYEGVSEGSGRSEKIWLEKDGQSGIFKFPKLTGSNGEVTKEYVSEKLATIIAEQIDVKTAKVDIGIRNGRIGSMSYSILQDAEVLIEGIGVISKSRPNYNTDKLQDLDTGEYYNLNMIEEVIKNFVNSVPNEVYKMLIFDFLIGNNDRHQNNWAFIQKTRENEKIDITFSPLYDNGSSLCSFIKEEDIQNYLNTNDMMKVNSLIDTKSKSIIRIDGNSKKVPTQLEFIKYLKKNNNDDIIDYVKYVIDKINTEKISEILEMFDDKLISRERKKLLKYYLNKKIELLNEVFCKGE